MFCSSLLLTSLMMFSEVQFRAQVEDVQGGQNLFFVDCTDVSLTSATINLNNFIGENVMITGDWNDSVENASVEVTDIEIVAETFGMGGSAQIGQEIRFEPKSAPGDSAVAFLSFDSSFVPTQAKGAFFLTVPLFIVGVGVIGNDGNFSVELIVPNDDALLGLEVFGQALVAPAAGGFFWSNPDCKTIDN